MTVYTINLTNQASIISSLEAAFTAEGLVSTVHYNTSPNLLLTLSNWDYPIKFNAPGYGRIFSYFGSGYTNGTNLDDQITISNDPYQTGTDTVLVLTADVIALCEYRTSYGYRHLFAKMNDVGATPIAWGWAQTSRPAGSLYNADLQSKMGAATARGTIMTAGGNYYQSDVLCLSNAGVEIATGITGLKVLHRLHGLTVSHEVAGDDVIIDGGGQSDANYYFQHCFLIEDGNL